MEYLDIVDLNGNPTGQIIERNKAHAEGIWHRTAHVWIYRIVDGRPQILLQKRCMTKDSFPGCYDISSAGHIPAGDGFLESAVRELEEELGVRVSAEELIFCGMRRIGWDGAFHGIPYHDRQVTKVFLLKLQGYEEQDFVPQESEIESVRWMDWEECLCAVRNRTIEHCMELEEMAILVRGEPRLEVDISLVSDTNTI